ncbi:MAG: adenylate kinase [Chloroflexia bacterium]|nr:adenylate kinase [Chloroflexia bacterium]
MHVILIGPQGSGKGTQSDRIRSRLNLASIATGELFRSAIKRGTNLGTRIQAIYDRGELVPDDLTIAIVRERLEALDAQRDDGVEIAGALYDGFPRTEGQADALDQILAARGEEVTTVIAIDVPREKLMERLAGRRVCAGCGRVYNVVTDPPLIDGVCDVCESAVLQRADDTPEAVAKRLDLYELETVPLVDRYAARRLLTRVDGDQSIDAVTEAIVSEILAKAHVAATPAN